ncbi:33496_t:CDS:2 [Gigaspora margarita]|uniref:33496_t:CDS:1 n=1 Tax=Gigaspora margarita TaxID=4874 RepID=A0ABN7V232_GIGMA|nr:33496_t:CDS:2 [Gigaspora margarita]
MSEESTSNAKKSRSLSDAERRLLRRQKRILNNANDRLGRITSTHSSSSLNTEPSSALTSRSVSPQPSLTSSPITSEAPDSIFSSRKSTGNFESLPPPLYSDSPLQSSPDRQTFTPLIRINNDTDPQKLFLQQDRENPSLSASTSDDDRNGYFENNEHSRRKLTNLDPANSSSASLTSISPEDLTIYDEINNYCTTLGALAANLPPPLSDALTILLRYNLIWNSLWEDICILGFHRKMVIDNNYCAVSILLGSVLRSNALIKQWMDDIWTCETLICRIYR